MDPIGQREPLPPAALDDLTDLVGGDVDAVIDMLSSFGLDEEAEQLSDTDDDEDDDW